MRPALPSFPVRLTLLVKIHQAVLGYWRGLLCYSDGKLFQEPWITKIVDISQF